MPVRVTWEDDAHTILRSDTYGEWDWIDYYQSLDEVKRCIESVPHRVDLICTRQPDAVSPPGSLLPHLIRAVSLVPRSLNTVVIVSQKPSAQALFGLFQLMRQRQAESTKVLVVPTLEEAFTMLADRRASPALLASPAVGE
ncbi:MAG: hypothetical protein JNM70_05505 [Anaerolineae bacterium]|nr:hypothetical protein [Anaerolineae bacterium]